MIYINIENQIVEFIQQKVHEARAKGIVVGLSGGIDSAVASALAVKAVGAENIIGVIMPCESNPRDALDARIHADRFDISRKIVDLEATYFALKNAINYPGTQISDANLKPRLRMCTLYNIANAKNYLVLGTCNKSEIMVGYETKYGDGGSDLSPLGDLYKWQVRALAYHLNIDAGVINKAPSAGLWDNQTDEEEMGITYEKLDKILHAIRMDNPDDFPIDEDYSRVAHLIKSSEHKRKMPDICMIK